MNSMSRLFSTACLALFALLCSSTTFAGPSRSTQDDVRPDVGEFRELAVLYAGFPGTARERAFVALLESAFAKVETVELESLDSAQAEGFDVVVADWTDRFEAGRFSGAQDIDLRLGTDFARPVVMVGALSGRVPQGTKFNHL